MNNSGYTLVRRLLVQGLLTRCTELCGVATCQFLISEPQEFYRIYNDFLAWKLVLLGKVIQTEHKKPWAKPVPTENTASSDLSVGTVHFHYRRLLLFFWFLYTIHHKQNTAILLLKLGSTKGSNLQSSHPAAQHAPTTSDSTHNSNGWILFFSKSLCKYHTLKIHCRQFTDNHINWKYKLHWENWFIHSDCLSIT